ncbi:DUF3618 domain-containing protein [Sphingomonas pokkalii]|uniref:DUF3618 domain-containing protein n=1 Tax=Sphingomonas pokkalii TaxID=2175090 RepID=A0A2U0SI89_9SPHN|nr:DUF3618 domain-containing protein [Sphingomonas pokkalii]PVX31049.1 hypothetical protein DD559_18350 [Sphingomonas pokkalii]
MTVPRDPDAARARARTARDKLMATVGTLQERLKPANLAQEAVENAKQSVTSIAREGTQAVRQRPWLAAAVTSGIGLVLARGWIVDIFRKNKHETADPAKGSASQDRIEG